MLRLTHIDERLDVPQLLGRQTAGQHFTLRHGQLAFVIAVDGMKVRTLVLAARLGDFIEVALPTLF